MHRDSKEDKEGTGNVKTGVVDNNIHENGSHEFITGRSGHALLFHIFRKSTFTFVTISLRIVNCSNL
uniref:Uncharacterized protein n=1 Tax=Vespula pensylvanica TaxID=30213 RepID=A0A834PGI3_VESPE|nr:hypothetical protein H0235_001571 [Vespula pensylvanica]